jgi:hypothetical protein
VHSHQGLLLPLVWQLQLWYMGLYVEEPTPAQTTLNTNKLCVAMLASVAASGTGLSLTGPRSRSLIRYVLVIRKHHHRCVQM